MEKPLLRCIDVISDSSEIDNSTNTEIFKRVDPQPSSWNNEYHFNDKKI